MLSTDQKLDDATVSAIMASKPFSRLPVGGVVAAGVCCTLLLRS